MRKFDCIKNICKKHFKPVIYVLVAVIVLVSSILMSTNGIWDKTFSALGLRTSLANTQEDKIIFFNVGQADCSLLCSNGHAMLIDAGGSICANNLFKKGVRSLDIVVISHPHSDHLEALSQLIKEIDIGAVIIAPMNLSEDKDEKIFIDAIETCEKYGIPTYNPQEISKLHIGDISAEFVFFDQDAFDENNCSAVLKATFEDKSFLYTGDCEEDAEEKMLSADIDINADVLKVGHHGSKTSSTENFLKKVLPQYAIISCGENNSFGHPNIEVLDRLKSVGAKIYRTDVNEDVTVYLDDELTVSSEY